MLITSDNKVPVWNFEIKAKTNFHFITIPHNQSFCFQVDFYQGDLLVKPHES